MKWTTPPHTGGFYVEQRQFFTPDEVASDDRPPALPFVHYIGTFCPDCNDYWWLGLSNRDSDVMVVNGAGEPTKAGWAFLLTQFTRTGTCAECRFS